MMAFESKCILSISFVSCTLLVLGVEHFDITKQNIDPFRSNHGDCISFKEEDLKIKASMFPQNFTFGFGTSAYQSEGAVTTDGRGLCIWDSFAHNSGKIRDGSNADVSCDGYHKYMEDVERMKSMGVESYRFSISWSRIIPNGTGSVNFAGIEFYNSFINYLLAAGIQPFVTLHHEDLPLFLYEQYGGWMNPRTIEFFVKFSSICFEEFGDRVKSWTTFNEPRLTAHQGYGDGGFPPGRCTNRARCPAGDSSREPYVVAHNILRAHAKVVHVYRKHFNSDGSGKIGISLGASACYPDRNTTADKEASERLMEFMFSWFADPVVLGKYPPTMRRLVGPTRLPAFTPSESRLLKNSVDFIGVNVYTGTWVKSAPAPPEEERDPLTDSCTTSSGINSDGNPVGSKTAASSWLYFVPSAIYDFTLWASKRYPEVALIITENGFSSSFNYSLPMSQALCDVDRVDYVETNLKYLLKAIRDGVKVEAYYAWSFVDVWEWTNGYFLGFGVYWVDYTDATLPRYAKWSATWWTKFLKTEQQISVI